MDGVAIAAEAGAAGAAGAVASCAIATLKLDSSSAEIRALERARRRFNFVMKNPLEGGSAGWPAEVREEHRQLSPPALANAI